MNINGAAFFILTALSSTCLAAGPVAFAQEAGKIQVSLEGRPFTTMFHAADLDKPFLHPLRTSTGIVVTRGWPIDPAPGDSDDHPHQRGLWWAHGLTGRSGTRCCLTSTPRRPIRWCRQPLIL